MDIGKISSDIAEVIKTSYQDLDFGLAETTITPPEGKPVHIQTKMHQGKPTTINISTYKTNPVKNNIEALALVGTLLRGVQASRQDGILTFSLSHKDGEVNKVMVQDLKHNTVKNWG